MRYCLFPFFDQYQLLNNRLLINGSIDYIMPFKFWHDGIVSSARRLNGVEILPFDENSMKYYDAIIILPSNVPHANKIILDFIFRNLKNNKKVYNFHTFSDDIYSTESESSIINDITCLPKVDIDVHDYTLNPIKATVIYNTSVVGGYYHTDVEFFLSKRLKEIGANVCVVSASPIAELYGCVPFPINEFKKVSLSESAKWINKFIHRLDENRNPDVFIISIPEPLISYNTNSCNIGALNYICANAVFPDYTILNIALDNYSFEMLNDNIILSKKRLNCDVDAVVLSDLIFDWIAYSENITPSYEFFRSSMSEQAYICDKLNAFSYDFGCVYNNQKTEDFELLFQNIISQITRRQKAIGYERIL